MATISAFRQLALALDGVVEQPHFNKTSFRVKKKIFATLDEEKNQAAVKLNEIEQSVFSAIDKTIIYPVAGKWGKQGWTIIELDKIPADILEDVITMSYRIVSGTYRADGH